MSSLQRSRSLRKPTTAPSAPSAPSGTDNQPDPRKVSPSRLPVNHAPKSASTSTTSHASGSARGSRPPSAGLRRSTSTKEPKPTAEPAKRPASRYPPISSANRPPVSTRPTSAGSRPASAGSSASHTNRAPAHARAKSTVTTLNSNLVLRPPSRDHGRPNATGATRSSHSRSTSVDRTTPTTSTAPPPAPTAATQAQPRVRPAFSTLQKHYSPAKSTAPKPLTSTYLAPPSPSKLPANVAASAETSRLQAELLQLHILHRESWDVSVEWRASAQHKLGERFAKLGAASHEVAEKERADLEGENIVALRGWGSSGGLEEKIQALENIISGIWSLSEPGGRYARVVRRFERWIEGVCNVEEARRDEGEAWLQGHDALFIGELDGTWKDECAGLTRRLDGWQRQLREIDQSPRGDGADKSSLTRMLDGSRSLLHDMSAELVAMEDIEREALAREDEWIEEMNRHDDKDDTPRAGAVWRVV